jgi:hypothetical protein
MPTSSKIESAEDGYGYYTHYRRRDRNWTNTPGYFTVPKSDLPENPYADTITSLVQQPGVQWLSQCSGAPTTFYASSALSHTQAWSMHDTYQSRLKLPSLSVLENECKVKALMKVSDSKVNLAVALAESRKTSDLIIGKASQLLTAYRSFRRGDLRKVARTLNLSPKTVHKTWLEYKYGWTPLLMDVKGSAELFAQDALGGRPPRFTVSHTVKAGNTVKARADPGPYFLTLEGEKVVRVKINCEVVNPQFNRLQQLGLTNPALVAWELVPFSFVFDWFCSVGDWLQGLTAMDGVTLRRAMISTLDISTCESYRVFPSTGGCSTNPITGASSGTIRSSATNTCRTNRRVYNRGFLTTASLTTWPPVSRDPLNMSRLVTSLALIRAQSRR